MHSKGILLICLLFCKVAQFVQIYQTVCLLTVGYNWPTASHSPESSFSSSVHTNKSFPNSFRMVVPSSRWNHCGQTDHYWKLGEVMQNTWSHINQLDYTAHHEKKNNGCMKTLARKLLFAIHCFFLSTCLTFFSCPIRKTNQYFVSYVCQIQEQNS